MVRLSSLFFSRRLANYTISININTSKTDFIRFKSLGMFVDEAEDGFFLVSSGLELDWNKAPSFIKVKFYLALSYCQTLASIPRCFSSSSKSSFHLAVQWTRNWITTSECFHLSAATTARLVRCGSKICISYSNCISSRCSANEMPWKLHIMSFIDLLFSQQWVNLLSHRQ